MVHKLNLMHQHATLANSTVVAFSCSILTASMPLPDLASIIACTVSSFGIVEKESPYSFLFVQKTW